MDELQNAAGFGFEDSFHDQIPSTIQDGDHYRFLVHVHADILDVVTHLSCLLGGKVIRANANLPLKVKCHSPADLPILSCCSFAPDIPPQLPPSAAAADRSPAQRSGADAAPHPASTF